MKIDFHQIVVDHFATLRDDRKQKLSLADVALFYVLPSVFAVAVYWLDFSLERDVYNVSITFFGIFVALLLNVQVAIFGIFQRKLDPPADVKLLPMFNERIAKRRELLGELNANLSYLTFICCVALIVFLSLYAFDHTSSIAVAATILIYSHFLLTLLMTVKRTHILFQKEYRA